MKVKTILSILTVAMLALFAASSAQAQLQIIIDPVTGAPGQTVAVYGALLNISPTDTIDLNGDSISLAEGSYFSVFSDNFVNTPLQLGPIGNSNSYYGDLFDVTIDPSTPYGSYTDESYTVSTDDFTTSSPLPDTTQDFSIDVPPPAPAPESSTEIGFGIMLALGGCALVLGRRRRVNA